VQETLTGIAALRQDMRQGFGSVTNYLAEKIEKLESGLRDTYHIPQLAPLPSLLSATSRIPFESYSGSAQSPVGNLIIKGGPSGGFIEVDNPVIPILSTEPKPREPDAAKSGSERTSKK
jgi:hypothetical protein